MTQTSQKPETPPKEQPPVFSNWSSWYALVLGALVLMMGLSYLITSSYS